MSCAQADTCHAASPISTTGGVASLAACEALCMSDATCRSVDYNTNTLQCEKNAVADEDADFKPKCPTANHVWSKKIRFGKSFGS